MSSTEEDGVLAALARYRWRVAQHNREIFTKIVKMAEEFQPERLHAPEQLNARRMRFINKQFHVGDGDYPGLDPGDRIETPADVLKKWPKLVRAYGLDGVHERKSIEERERDRAAFKGGIMAGLQERLGDDDSVADLQFPVGFWVMMGQIDSLHGHGWPKYHQHDTQPTLWDGIDEHVGAGKASLIHPDDISELYGVQNGWEVLGGWWNAYENLAHTQLYVLYCRADETASQKESDASWQWRYVVDANENGEEWFDTLPELLAWYGEYGVPDLDHVDRYIGSI